MAQGSYASFLGPDPQGTVYFQDPQGMRQPMFTVSTSKSKPNVQIFRILPGGHQAPFATASWSSLSGSVKTSIEGAPEIKMELSYSKGTPDLQFRAPTGHKLRWKYGGWGNVRDLYDDEAKVKVATYKTSSSGHDLPRLDVLVQDTNQFVDMVVALALSVAMNDRKDDKQFIKAVKIVGNLAG